MDTQHPTQRNMIGHVNNNTCGPEQFSHSPNDFHLILLLAQIKEMLLVDLHLVTLFSISHLISLLPVQGTAFLPDQLPCLCQFLTMIKLLVEWRTHPQHSRKHKLNLHFIRYARIYISVHSNTEPSLFIFIFWLDPAALVFQHCLMSASGRNGINNFVACPQQICLIVQHHFSLKDNLLDCNGIYCDVNAFGDALEAPTQKYRHVNDASFCVCIEEMNCLLILLKCKYFIINLMNGHF